jgi:Zn-dependent protease with chaperone function
MANRTGWGRGAALLVISCFAAGSLQAQTALKLAKNRYTPEQDVKLGLEAAAEIEKEYPIIKDERITRYLTMLGERLVAVAPAELNNPLYKYSFTPVNLKEINAFALPGGPMFVQRGMFTAAAAEGEVVGVMAHELSHVLLRHGTANASKAQNPWLQIGQMAGQIGGAVLGGGVGAMVAQGAEMGLGAMLLRYSRDFEKQADLLGAQIMARAGYDPRALGRMFETIEKESKAGGGGDTPQWLSSHPNPGNRTAYINKEAESLTVAKAADDTGFAPAKSVFESLPAALTMEELAKRKAGGGGNAMRSVGTPGQPIPPPSAEYQAIAGGKLFQAQVPANWTALSTSNSIRIVPENGFGDLNGQQVFSHGVEFGIAQAGSRDLRQATEAFLKVVAQNNPGLKLAGEARQMTFSQRPAIGVPLTNPSPLGGQERIGFYTMFVGNGSTLFYYLTIAPEKDSQALQETFRRIAESVRFSDAR